MNLRWFHALLILLSAALAVLFGVWSLGVYGREDGTANLVTAVVANTRIWRRLLIVVIVIFLFLGSFRSVLIPVTHSRNRKPPPMPFSHRPMPASDQPRPAVTVELRDLTANRGDVRFLEGRCPGRVRRHVTLEVLDVHGESTSTWVASDALCAGLQINNHLQDCAKDYKNLNRVYLPRDALASSGATVEMLGEAKSQPALLQCLQGLAVRTETLLNESKSLSAEVKDFRLGLEVAVIQTFADKIVGMLKDVAYQMRTPEFWNSMDMIGGQRSYWLGGSFGDG